ncbi:MAG: tRNA pseudouridine(55) synthase TruB [candidate division Zixibacteria bacterium]|nr:tRNA pseudouridine(55) synthase TruB [candidate division Zixibacteria bacterium]
MSHKSDNYHGLLLLSKPGGISSHDAVDRVRKILSQRSVGHAGTLDPAAEGLLIMLLGKATKIAQYLTNQDKEYEAEISLGQTSSTYDAEGVDSSIEPKPVPKLSADQLEQLLSDFRGAITQKVPPISAVHVDGERLYRKTRRGEKVDTPERNIRIDSLEVIGFDETRIRIRLTCSKGTYVRSLAHDIGERLGCGGYLSYLKRTRSGKFGLKEALTLENIEQLQQTNELSETLLSIDQTLDFSSVTVNESFQGQVQYGRRPRGADITGVDGDFQLGDNVLLKNQRGIVLAIGTAVVAATGLTAEPQHEVIKYNRVFS